MTKNTTTDRYRLRRDADIETAHWWILYDPAGQALVAWNHKPEKDEVQGLVAKHKQGEAL